MQVDSTRLKLATYRGGIALIGPALLDAAHHFGIVDLPHNPLHITLLTSSEYKPSRDKHQPRSQLDTRLPDVPLHRIYILGVIRRKNVTFLVVLWNHADVWRKSLRLQKKEYHVTFSNEDDHNHINGKGISALLVSADDRDGIVENVIGLGGDAMDNVVVGCWGDLSLQRELSHRFVLSFPNSFKAYLRLAEVSLDPKVQMLALTRAASLNPDMTSIISTKICKLGLNGQTSWGPVVTAAELENIPHDLQPLLVHDFPAGLAPPDLWLTPMASRDRVFFLGSSSLGLPRFFSWLYPDRIAGMSSPRSKADVELLTEMGFTHVLSLTEESPLDESWFILGPEHIFIPIPNYDAPTVQEMDHIYEKIMEGGVWLIHCGGGVGRAGTVLASLITMLGKEGTDTEGPNCTPKLDANTAIGLIRQIRPRSLESMKQEQVVTKWVPHRWAMAYQRNEIVEPCTSLQRDGDLPLRMDNALLFLIGKPGSGKSWFSAAVSKRRPPNATIVISQDDNGSRAACEREMSRQGHCNALVIFDRCNPLAADRKTWLKLADRPCIAIYFDYPKALCEQRINARLDHPTIRAGMGANALNQFAQQMQPPTLDEGFAAILTITSLAAARDAVRLVAKDSPLLKFPRTAHLLDLGSTSSDDIVLEEFPTMSGNLTIEEKIDGANMGFSLDWDKVIRCQNRSHWISSNDHAQFRPLDRWIDAHSEGLRKLLERDKHFPERYILYGEWMVAKHSIHYTQLPDTFIAYDMSDRLTQTFLSRSSLTHALKGTGIHQVPLIARAESLSREQVMEMLERKSEYAPDSKIEGVYVKTEDATRTMIVGRGKVVRGDFIVGNEHWTRGPMIYNGTKSEMT